MGQLCKEACAVYNNCVERINSLSIEAMTNPEARRARHLAASAMSKADVCVVEEPATGTTQAAVGCAIVTEVWGRVSAAMEAEQ